MARIHWIGTGLSTVPGIRRLITQGRTITLWNRTVEKANEAAAGLTGDFDIREFSMGALGEAVERARCRGLHAARHLARRRRGAGARQRRPFRLQLLCQSGDERP